ncbi:MAG: biotin-dependent carboxyltransferase family protein [Gillisia sp.]
MGEIEVLQPGLFTSVQDLGRFGFREFGVPQSGVMDKYAAKMANLLVGNSGNAAVLEITQSGPTLKFLNTAIISICGADLSPRLDGEPLQDAKIYNVPAGAVLSFGRRKTGCRAYLAIKGGFNSEEILNSRSWYKGLTSNFKLQKGMKINCFKTEEAANVTHTVVKFRKEYLGSNILEVFAGPEFELLSREQQERVFHQNFTIDKHNNRMAIQLQEPLENTLEAIITGPVLPGTVQLTPSGKMIILMKDCQTTGGYPRILQFSENALNSIAQKVMGERVEFVLKE